MELKDLVGTRVLEGLDRGIQPSEDSYSSDGEVFIFILDGKTYKAIEDPSDGYRSMMQDLQETDEQVKNMFGPQVVIGRMVEDDVYQRNDIIEFVNPDTGRVVLQLGTSNWDDYYPSCVMNFYPEELTINKPKKEDLEKFQGFLRRFNA